VISSVVQNAVQLWLNQANVSGSSTNLISTPFTANGSGVDNVLDLTTVDLGTGEIVISSGTVTQTSVLTAATGSMNLVTTTTSTSGDSSSTIGTIVPVLAAQQTALDGITTAFNNFAGIVNTKGASLAATDLYPVLDASGSWGGLTRDQWAQLAVYAFRGKTISFSGIAIKSLNGTTADTIFKLSETKGGQTSTSPNEFFFKKTGGTWLLSGDQRIAMVEVRAARVRNQGSATNTNLALEINIDAPRSSPTVTSLSSVVISGGPWSGATLTYGGQNAAPWDDTLTLESFSTYTIDPVGISGGELFTIKVAPMSDPTGTVTYTVALNAVTTEPISITNLAAGATTVTGSTMADAHLGSPLTVDWTLPKTFAITQVKLGSVAYTGVPNDQATVKCDDMGEVVVLGITSTHGQITIPATCNGKATAEAEIYLQVYGINGEFTTVYYTFHN
jgi:hypothetical protein